MKKLKDRQYKEGLGNIYAAAPEPNYSIPTPPRMGKR